MRKRIIIWLGLALAIPAMIMACSGNTTPISAPEEESIDETEAQAVEVLATEVSATEAPKSNNPRIGDIAPDFTLLDSNGRKLTLSDELQENRSVALVFYHAYG